jgi:hypothetical protein
MGLLRVDYDDSTIVVDLLWSRISVTRVGIDVFRIRTSHRAVSNGC